MEIATHAGNFDDASIETEVRKNGGDEEGGRMENEAYKGGGEKVGSVMGGILRDGKRRGRESERNEKRRQDVRAREQFQLARCCQPEPFFRQVVLV